METTATGGIDKDLHWYAVYTASRAEKKVKERLDELGIECYLPLQTVIRIWSDRKKKVVVPVINGYIFVRIHIKDFRRVQEIQGVAFFLKEKGKAVPIPDEQIKTLRFMVDNSEDEVEFSADDFKPGAAVMITRGQLQGLIGELVEVRGKYKVAIRLENFGCALTTVSVGSLKKL